MAPAGAPLFPSTRSGPGSSRPGSWYLRVSRVPRLPLRRPPPARGSTRWRGTGRPRSSPQAWLDFEVQTL